MSSGNVKLHTATGAVAAVHGDVVPEPPVKAGSIVARLRENARVQLEEKTTEIPVGGEFGDRLYIKYGVLGPSQMDRFIASRQGARPKDLSITTVTMDMMARACIGLIGRYQDEEEQLADGDGPIRLENRLAILLDLRSPSEPSLTAHDVITRLFGQNGAAITAHGDKLYEWMTSAAEAEGDGVGES